MTESAESLQEQLTKLRAQLEKVENQLDIDLTPKDEKHDLTARQLALLEKEKRIDAKLERIRTASAAPTAPPGNSIILPRVLPSFFYRLSSLSFQIYSVTF